MLNAGAESGGFKISAELIKQNSLNASNLFNNSLRIRFQPTSVKGDRQRATQIYNTSFTFQLTICQLT